MLRDVVGYRLLEFLGGATLGIATRCFKDLSGGVRCTCVGCVVRCVGKGIYLGWLPAVNVWEFELLSVG